MKTEENLTNYEDWYVLQVKPGREVYVKEFIEFYSKKTVKLIIFNRELIHRKNGESITILNPLFPGYIFVYKDITYVTTLARKILHNEFIRPVKFSASPAKVKPEEMMALLRTSCPAGTITLSQARKSKNTITITKGPLKDMCVRILFINEKKRKVKVEFTLLGRVITMSLGFDFTDLETSAA